MIEKIKKVVEQVRSVQEQNAELENLGVYIDYKTVWITLKNEDGTKVKIKVSIDVMDRRPPETR